MILNREDRRITFFSKVSLAPMAGICDNVLRSFVREYSNRCLITTEMISSEALCNCPNCKIIEYEKKQSPIAFQLVGHKVDVMTQAAKILEKRADIIDINMGCPVKKVVGGSDGSALMRAPKVASDIVKSIKDSIEVPVSVKIRLGFTSREENFVEFGKLMEESGACMITIHARTRSQMYGGKADWKKIGKLVKEVEIPVFVNGDIVDLNSAKEAILESNAFGVSIGRGILYDPSLIFRVEEFIDSGFTKIVPPLNFIERIEFLKKYLTKEVEYRTSIPGIKFMRKFYSYFIQGFENAARYRQKLVVEENYEKIIKILDEIKEVVSIYG